VDRGGLGAERLAGRAGQQHAGLLDRGQRRAGLEQGADGLGGVLHELAGLLGGEHLQRRGQVQARGRRDLRGQRVHPVAGEDRDAQGLAADAQSYRRTLAGQHRRNGRRHAEDLARDALVAGAGGAEPGGDDQRAVLGVQGVDGGGPHPARGPEAALDDLQQVTEGRNVPCQRRDQVRKKEVGGGAELRRGAAARGHGGRDRSPGRAVETSGRVRRGVTRGTTVPAPAGNARPAYDGEECGMKVCVVGTGYVGLTTGVSLAFLGHDVTCVDLDQAKVDLLSSGRSPIYEPHMESLLTDAAEHLTFTTDYGKAVPEAEVVFIAVQTPSLPDGNPDLRYLRSAAESVGRHVGDSFTVVVNKSTVPIGSSNWVDSILREAFEQAHERRSDGEFSVASNPEFLRQGAAIRDTLYPDRIVVGSDNPRSLDVLNQLYRSVINQTFTPPAYLPRPAELGAVPLVSTDLASAELIKYAANAFLALKISFANEIGQLSGRVGADITQVTRGIGLDTRIGSRFLQPGIGWGGSCFGKDTAALIATAAEYHHEMPIVAAARSVNQLQRRLVVDRLLEELRILKGRRIGLLGLAFKPETDDMRDAPALDIASMLLDRGARISLHDPVAAERLRRERPDLAPHLADDVEQVFDDSDAVILVTEWAQYLDLDWGKYAPAMRRPLVLDGRHCLDPERLGRLGYKYLSV
jgi:UDPglucose 6-dehydrogenase